MSNIETLFNPRDDSLTEKVNAYYSVCRDYARVQASLKQTKQGKNTDFIGEHDEVVSAYELISQSLHQANSKVSQSDLKQAKDKGLLNDNQLMEIIQVQRLQEMDSKRQNKNSDSHSSSQRR